MDRHPLVITRHWDGSVHVRGLMPDQQVTTLPDGGLEISQVPAPVPQVLQLIQTPGTYLSLSMHLLDSCIWKLCSKPTSIAIATKEGPFAKSKGITFAYHLLLSLGRKNLRAETRF